MAGAAVASECWREFLVKSLAQDSTAVHVVNRLAPGGIETLVLDLLRAATSGQRVVVFSLEGTPAELIEAWPALREFEHDLFAFSAPSGRRLSVIPKLRAALRQLHPDRVFVHHIGPLLYGGLAARLARVGELVHVEHDAWHYDQTPGHARILKWCERLLKPQHLAVSHAIKRRMLDMVGGAHISVVPPGIDTGHYEIGDRAAARQRLGIPVDGDVIGTVGRLDPVKGHRFLIDAMANLEGDARLVVVGDGDERARLENQVRALSLSERVLFLGHREDVAQIFPALDVFCLPSLNEGLPRVVLEAQACGIPVVASDVGAVSDAVFGEVGRLVAPGDVEDLTKALAEILRTPRDGQRTRAFVASNYDFSITKRHYEAMPQAHSDIGVLREAVSA